MISVEQTNISSDRGNCFPSCLASILEIGLEDIPQTPRVGYYEEYLPFLATLNLTLVFVTQMATADLEACGYYLIGAASPRFPGVLHAVVGKSGQIAWDPHPLRAQGVGAIADYMFLTQLDPARPNNKLDRLQALAADRRARRGEGEERADNYEGNPSERL